MDASRFLAMGGYAWYVWPAFAVAALVMIVMLVHSLAAYSNRRRELDALQQRRPTRRRRR
jgi:heme exporter protein D